MIEIFPQLSDVDKRYSVDSVLVLVVTYNAEEWITTFIGKSTGIPHSQFLIVDNGSTDQTVSVLKKLYPAVTLFEANKNLGFGGGNNIGFNYALDKGYEYVFLLNQDAYITTENLCITVAVQKKTQAGIVSPVQYSAEENLDRSFAMYLGRDNIQLKQMDGKEHAKSSFVNAALWLIPTEIINIVGGFDPIFFHYGEDNDYVNRINYYGYDLVIATEAKGYHLRQQHSANRSDKQLIQAAERRCMIAAKNINQSIGGAVIKTIRTAGSQLKRYYLQKKIGFVLRLFKVYVKLIGLSCKVIKHRRICREQKIKRAFLKIDA